jgi:class 3 adenylate cyclase
MYHVSVFNAHQHRQVSVREGMTRIGRAPAGTSDAGYITVDDLLLDATQLELQQVRRDIVQVGNVGGPAVNVNGEELNHGEHRKLRLPVQIQAGRTHLWIAAEFPGLSVQKETVTDARDASGLVTSGPVVECYRLPRPSLAGEFHDASATSWPAPAPETLAKWFSALAAVQREIPGSRSFHDRIVEAIVRTGGLDAGLYLEPSEDEWRIIASCVSEPPRGIGFDSSLVDAVNESGETIWTLRLDGDRSAAESSEACVATPVFDEAQRVVGVLYGSRVLGARNRRREVRPLEARWLQVLAESVTSGIARARAEVALARQRVILEQSFPSSVVKQILRDSKNLLQSEEREVTILFVDLIESSVISEQLDSRDSDCLLGDLLDCLTRIVQDHEGVIVDYYGDGLVAMWNAPLDQSDHMLRACRSGLQMISEESALSARWQPKLHRPLRLGVGIHCGTAWVGNSGSRFGL